jgi:hypothetical protein
MREMVALRTDLDFGQGRARCAMGAPDLFDIDSSDEVVPLRQEVSDERTRRSRRGGGAQLSGVGMSIEPL